MAERRNIAGERVKLARLAEKPPATQKDISARLELIGIILSDSAIGKIEHGASSVTDVQLDAFAKALKVKISWLMKEE
ncbi:MAG: helix-turn-helix domain-containing protein [Oscillospiraceae bacterium]|nr:helix-turn-helix domain-containing protein [Oscillospiraceae bacterium]